MSLSGWRQILSRRLDPGLPKWASGYVVKNDIAGHGSSTQGPSAALRVLGLLRTHRDDLKAIGLRHADIFGSVARGEERPDSDVDILVDLDPTIVRDLLGYSRVQRTLEDLVGMRVDIAERSRLRHGMQDDVEQDKINAF